MFHKDSVQRCESRWVPCAGCVRKLNSRKKEAHWVKLCENAKERCSLLWGASSEIAKSAKTYFQALTSLTFTLIFLGLGSSQELSLPKVALTGVTFMAALDLPAYSPGKKHRTPLHFDNPCRWSNVACQRELLDFASR